MKYGDGTRPEAPQTVRAADPRIPYYFFNQLRGVGLDAAAYDYQDPQNPLFATTRQGSTGIANASTLSASTRTLPGLYPMGGRYDDGRGGNVNTTFGRGLVAQRLLPYFNLKFLEAEAQLEILGDRAAARTALKAAVEAAFSKVNAIATAEGAITTPTTSNGSAYPTTTLQSVPLIPETAIIRYVNEMLVRFDGTSQGGLVKTPLQVIMEEKYVSSFGMGTDIYTDWRRTGFPQITVPDAVNIGYNVGLLDDNDSFTRGVGLFPRRLFYSLQDLTANPNPEAPKTQVDPSPGNLANYRIFWDR